MPKKNNSHTELLAERLKAARLFAGFATSLKFAKAHGVNQKLYEVRICKIAESDQHIGRHDRLT
ncbi:MAG: hypothetical protein CMM57_03545 [Rhodospirillaceae bacterium]|nr:hypothetical protein [Rhodospirillaceae bacterium]